MPREHTPRTLQGGATEWIGPSGARAAAVVASGLCDRGTEVCVPVDPVAAARLRWRCPPAALGSGNPANFDPPSASSGRPLTERYRVTVLATHLAGQG